VDSILSPKPEQRSLQPMSWRPVHLALSSWLLATPLSGQAAPASAAIVEARRMVSDTMRSLGAPGAAICVRRDGRIVWSQAFGFADLEQRVPVTRETRFRIASVSKALTSTALGVLLERGKLDLDAPVQRYVPSFPAKPYPITVRQVAGHLAGIRHYREGEFESQRHYASLRDGLRIFAADSLLFRPGTRFEYSSYGWNLIGAVIEGASGESYAGFMRREVLMPLGMSHTVVEDPDSIIPHRARSYQWNDSLGRVLNAPYVDNTYKWPSGGFLSSAEDLARFGDAMTRGRLIRRATVELLWISQRTSDGRETGNGIGWYVDRDPAGRRRVWHDGGGMGATSTLLIYPEQRLVVALLVNSDRTFIHSAPLIAELFLR
jgi:serine beta-lactamase-like protein LACTB, mitochondrial